MSIYISKAIFQLVNPKLPVRFAMGIDGSSRKIFNYFYSSKDGSIGFHSYFEPTHIHDIHIDKPTEEISIEERTIHLSEAEKDLIKFTPNKTSFHKSGIITIKNTTGLRPNEKQDIHSIPFLKIDKSIRLCHYYPAHYHRYPLINLKDKNKKFIKIEIPDDFKDIPFMIDIYLSSKNYNFRSTIQDKYPSYVIFIDQSTLSFLDLEIWTVFRKSINNKYLKCEGFAFEYY